MASFTLTTALAALTLLANTASCHLIMQKPVPFGADSLDNSPLEDAFPGNYPCKQRAGVYDITTMNFMKVGDPQELSFEGSASHGGGTCQLAVTMDTEPTPDSVFKIIQVYEGGCPVSSSGNSGTDQFTFQIPEGFPNGVSTFAWYWNNKIGNRESYMNCAPITVSGGADDLDYFNTLPNLFLVNLPSSDCEAPESGDVTIPNPGQFVVKDPQAKPVAPSGPKCKAMAAAQTEGVQGGGGAPAATTAPAAAPSGASPPAGSAPAPGGYSPPATSAAAGAGPGMITMSTAISPAPAAPTSSAAAAAPSSDAEPSVSSDAGVAAPSGAVPSGSSSGGSYPGSSGGMQCSPDGTKFGLTTASGETIWQAMAPGTKCQNGSIVKREQPVDQFRNPHVRRHVRGAGAHKRFSF